MKKIGSPFILTIRSCKFFFFCPNLASASLSFVLMSHLLLAAVLYLSQGMKECPRNLFHKKKKKIQPSNLSSLPFLKEYSLGTCKDKDGDVHVKNTKNSAYHISQVTLNSSSIMQKIRQDEELLNAGVQGKQGAATSNRKLNCICGLFLCVSYHDIFTGQNTDIYQLLACKADTRLITALKSDIKSNFSPWFN